ncbi:phospho-sugar mutase [Marinilabilia salmonicolor]|jgi:phosphoglucomutase|uniref:Phosphoglucomutase n=1 Tax=Marinilabilia salmonicolor TaxID=989 RepID=A0A2T0XAQ3_9BACT|nr:phospho-sugar mutase [Marinilabilia salmonicolor]PRY96015.1 phosphoglucomutase [Marinilabilia salmonicolor]RCW29430.1 phosphoglucomutase [Marinilabilia salmonicolor]
MTKENIPAQVIEKANQWLNGKYDDETKATVKRMLDADDPSELIDAFYKDLEFGTGGLRGVMGIGSNRMNRYTVGTATQGLANYLKKEFSSLPEIKVVIGYDCRNNSRYFAETAANIFSANGIRAFIFEDLRPTPEISYAIRELKCQSGIILTASHNPKEYNGYKAYWEDGAQILGPHDKNIINEVQSITDVADIKFDGNDELIETLGAAMDEKFLQEVTALSFNPDVVQRQKDMKIVFSPIHGTTVKMVPAALERMGFRNVIHVPEQDVVSGDFPTVISPNPEEPAALEMAINKAEETNADIVIATDPDGDRLGIAVRDEKGEFVLVNGNQTAILLTWYMLNQWKEKGMLTGKEFTVKTIVTSELIKTIADKAGVECFDTYTGFKWIAGVIRENEGIKKYICGGEESYGFMPGDYVRDKDSVGSIVMIGEIAAWAKDQNKSVYDLLKDIYIENGFSQEKMKYIVRKGKSGAEEIEALMKKFRETPPAMLGGSKVSHVKDYLTLKTKDLISGETTDITDKPTTSNVLQFFTEDGSKVSVRPSGTEPKIKFYFEVRDNMNNREEFNSVSAKALKKIDSIMTDMEVGE